QPHRQRLPSPPACARPLRSRSLRSPPQPLGATGERTDLNRGESHAPIRSRSTVSDGGGDTTLESQRQATFGKSSQPPPPESAPLTGRHHDVEDDIVCARFPAARLRAGMYESFYLRTVSPDEP